MAPRLRGVVSVELCVRIFSDFDSSCAAHKLHASNQQHSPQRERERERGGSAIAGNPHANVECIHTYTHTDTDTFLTQYECNLKINATRSLCRAPISVCPYVCTRRVCVQQVTWCQQQRVIRLYQMFRILCYIHPEIIQKCRCIS